VRKPFNIPGLMSFRDDDGKSRVRTCGLNLFAVVLLGLCLTARGEPLRIVVAGDGRADYPDRDDPNHLPSPRSEDKQGLNQIVTAEIRDAVLREKAQILLWTGDIANVNYTAGPKPEDKTNFLKNGLTAWRDIMEPLYTQGVKVLPTRGNHEVFWYDENFKEQKIDGATDIWTKVFSDRYALPVSESEKISFYYVQNPVLVVGLDSYETEKGHSINQDWLDKVLEKNKQSFIFAYCHEPAFAAGGRHGPDDTLARYADQRDGMWKSLYQAGARAYFCGHDHFYDHMLVTAQDGSCEMHQLTAGTAGAPFYCRGPYPPEKRWNLKTVRHFDFTYGYILITIDGNSATIAFKGRAPKGEYIEKDSFKYTPNSSTN
jgi:calcineurin-like phosphoesterase family protein